MNDEGISSLAVVDNHANVVGNISTIDVKVCHCYLFIYLPKRGQGYKTNFL